jgi:hypothetical protein
MCFATPNVSPILGGFVKPPSAAEMAISGGEAVLLGSDHAKRHRCRNRHTGP